MGPLLPWLETIHRNGSLGIPPVASPWTWVGVIQYSLCLERQAQTLLVLFQLAHNPGNYSS